MNTGSTARALARSSVSFSASTRSDHCHVAVADAAVINSNDCGASLFGTVEIEGQSGVLLGGWDHLSPIIQQDAALPLRRIKCCRIVRRIQQMIAVERVIRGERQGDPGCVVFVAETAPEPGGVRAGRKRRSASVAVPNDRMLGRTRAAPYSHSSTGEVDIGRGRKVIGQRSACGVIQRVGPLAGLCGADIVHSG